MLNIAEGAGKFSKPDKPRYYLTSVGSATETAAIVDVLLKLKLTTPEAHHAAKQLLERIVAMLIKLAKALEAG